MPGGFESARGSPARSGTESGRTCRASRCRFLPRTEGRYELLDPLRASLGARGGEPPPPAVPIGGEKLHPALWRGLDDDVRRRLSTLSRPPLTVEADRVASILAEAHGPCGRARRTCAAPLE